MMEYQSLVNRTNGVEFHKNIDIQNMTKSPNIRIVVKIFYIQNKVIGFLTITRITGKLQCDIQVNCLAYNVHMSTVSHG